MFSLFKFINICIYDIVLLFLLFKAKPYSTIHRHPKLLRPFQARVTKTVHTNPLTKNTMSVCDWWIIFTMFLSSFFPMHVYYFSYIPL